MSHKGFRTNQSRSLFVGKNGVFTKAKHGICGSFFCDFLDIFDFLLLGIWHSRASNAFEVSGAVRIFLASGL